MLAGLSGLAARMLREGDKQQHIAWSFWMTLAAFGVLGAGAAFSLVMLVGLAKECWDEWYGSGFCRYDLLANVIGACAALLVFPIAAWLVRILLGLPW